MGGKMTRREAGFLMSIPVRLLASRGSNTVMQLRWKPAWTNDKLGYFTGAILDGPTRVAKLLGSPGTVGVWPLASPQQYSVLTFASRTTNSAVTVDGTNGFREMYMIDGRNTTPLNEVDYTKMRLFEDFAWKPLAETITNQAEKMPPDPRQRVSRP